MTSNRLAVPVVIVLGLALFFFISDRGPDEDQGLEGTRTEQATEGMREPAEGLREASPAGGESSGLSEASGTGDEPEKPAVSDDEPVSEPTGDVNTGDSPTARDLMRESFQNEHHGLTVPELRAERAALDESIASAKKTAIEQRFEDHNFDIVYVGDAPGVPAPLGPGDRKMLTEVRTTVDPDTLQVAAHVVELPFDEYPELYALLDQSDWLGEMIGE